MAGVITASEPSWIGPFTGLSPRQFNKLITALRREGADPVRKGRPWSLRLEDRVLLVAAYWRTNLTLRQIAPLFGISKSAADRIVDHLGPALALQPRRRFRKTTVLIVDGTLVPTRDRTVAASSKNYRYSTNHQVVIDADTRLVVAVGRPLPGNRNDCRAWEDSGAKAAVGTTPAVIADGGYRGTGLTIPHYRRHKNEKLPPWKQDHNASHRKVRARVERTFAHMKSWKILRDCRLKGDGVHHAILGIARLHNLTLAVDQEAMLVNQHAIDHLRDNLYRDPAAARAKFGEIADSWLAAQIHLKRSTRNRYRGVLDVHVIPRWGTTSLDRIHFEDIAEWLANMLSGQAAGGRKLSPRSVRKAYVVLSRVLGYAVKARRLAVNPALGVPLPKPAPTDHVYLDDMQVEALANAAGAYRVFIQLLAYTGLRWGEASALKVGRVDLAACRAHIVEAYVEDNGKLYLDTPKNHERRSVPIPRFLAEELKPHVERRDDEELLFTAPQGGPLRARNFRQRFFAPAVTRAGLGHLKVTPHKLRHTAASLAIASGADVNVVQTMLGHKSATLTLDTYGHLFPDRLDEVSKKMHKRRSKQLAKAKAKLEKAERKAREAAETVATLEEDAA